MRQTTTIGLAFTLWTALLGILLVNQARLDLYIVLLLIGLLVLRALLGAYASERLTARLSIFIFLGLLAFTYIVVERVREILHA